MIVLGLLLLCGLTLFGFAKLFDWAGDLIAEVAAVGMFLATIWQLFG